MIFSPKKIRRLRPGLNPRSWVLEASTLTTRPPKPLLHTHITDTFLIIFHTTKVLLFKFRCNIFIGVRIIKEMPGSVASGTPCISTHTQPEVHTAEGTLQKAGQKLNVKLFAWEVSQNLYLYSKSCYIDNKNVIKFLEKKFYDSFLFL